MIDPLDRFEKHSRIEHIGTVLGGRSGLFEANIKADAAEVFNFVEEPIREVPELLIFHDVSHDVEAAPLLFPEGGVLTGLLDFCIEELTFPLEEPRPESAHFLRGEDESGESKNWALIILQSLFADVWPDMPKFIKIGQIRHRETSRHTKAHTRSVGLGKRARQACVSPENICKRVADAKSLSEHYGSPLSIDDKHCCALFCYDSFSSKKSLTCRSYLSK